ncbi:MAG: alpha-L-rhamnosidase C-terminal domain-containing protein, partial [Clostridia bacterium]|nr:alpha-L-rhamnosidase C-terminal domain-containing protein [Clostridia bacterium]
HAIALYFKLAKDMKKTAKSLADMVKANGNKLTTGFVGTPYLLHALSQNGYADVAYSILLQEEYPSWLFSVKMGATTIWEHWDGKKEDGTFWSTDMNSFNHYAYGAVADWVYMVAAGINRVEEAPGFKKIMIKPTPDKRLGYLEASIETRKGKVRSKWTYEDEGFIRYEIETPVETEVIIGEETKIVPAGEYMFIQYI